MSSKTSSLTDIFAGDITSVRKIILHPWPPNSLLNPMLLRPREGRELADGATHCHEWRDFCRAGDVPCPWDGHPYGWTSLGDEPQLGLQLSGHLELEPVPVALFTLPQAGGHPQLLVGPASLSAASNPSWWILFSFPGTCTQLVPDVWYKNYVFGK